ncbi:MAG: ABC transporter permease, partial [Bryobacteraceae bacterium]
MSQHAYAAASGFGILGLPSSKASNAEFAFTFAVSENYYKVLGVTALRGRAFDSISVREPSVLISENYWQKRFAGDPAALGKSVRLNGA